MTTADGADRPNQQRPPASVRPQASAFFYARFLPSCSLRFLDGGSIRQSIFHFLLDRAGRFGGGASRCKSYSPLLTRAFSFRHRPRSTRLSRRRRNGQCERPQLVARLERRSRAAGAARATIFVAAGQRKTAVSRRVFSARKSSSRSSALKRQRSPFKARRPHFTLQPQHKNCSTQRQSVAFSSGAQNRFEGESGDLKSTMCADLDSIRIVLLRDVA